MQKDYETYRRACEAWQAAAVLRARRERHKQYTYGDQWCDIVPDGCGNMVSERRLVESTGKRPQTNNLIRRLVKTVVGRYRDLAAAGKYYDPDPAGIDSRNCLAELDARLLEEYVISGCAVQRVVDEVRPRGSGVWIDNVNPAAFFVNRFTDPRGFDIDFAGMMHDMAWPEVVNRFSGGSRTRMAALKMMYDRAQEHGPLDCRDIIGVSVTGDDSFGESAPGRMRVIETWSLEGRQTVVRGRVRMDMVWHCRWLGPDATLLAEYNSPWGHGGHPFVVKFYPLTDGEVHSFVEDVIDQQRAVNRLVVLADSMMASSAKGALLFPMDQLAKGVTLEDIGRLWARPDSVIPISGQGATMPSQVVTSNTGSAPYQLLALQMKLFDDISGVGDALLGRNVSPSTGAGLYEAQVRNAATVLTDLLESFASFTAERNEKARNTPASLEQNNLGRAVIHPRHGPPHPRTDECNQKKLNRRL